jgi:hypothetical protein
MIKIVKPPKPSAVIEKAKKAPKEFVGLVVQEFII